MPTAITTGAASAKGYGFAAQASGPAVYVEDVFSTYLYTGTGASQTITNGVDLSTKGGLVWIKSRFAATSNFMFDTVRGTTKEINSDTTDGEATLASSLTAFNTDGFTVSSATGVGVNAATYVSWTFRKQAKFFDIVTYTGNSTNRTISHNLGSVPGCIMVKCTSTTGNWIVYHRSLTNYSYYLMLNQTGAETSSSVMFNSTAPTATEFSLGTNTAVNSSGQTYVAYLFAHDAGGFGLSGTDNVISCGAFSTDSSGAFSLTLGWEPQFLLFRPRNQVANFMLVDNMRGFSVTSSRGLYASTSTAEFDGPAVYPTATGAKCDSGINANGNYIYIAIRRGPMKTPTDATKVFKPYVGADSNISTGFPVDMFMINTRGSQTNNTTVGTRLVGSDKRLVTSNTSVEATASFVDAVFQSNTSYDPQFYGSGSLANFAFRRAPGFFDVVCFTGAGSSAATAYSHNLGVTPQFIIVKRRDGGTADWIVYHDGVPSPLTNQPALNLTGGYYANDYFSASPTSTQFTVRYLYSNNYVAYLFATCAGVSKVGSYTGTGTTKQIDCGFTGGARFVLIKRTDSTGDWYVWDTARGIVSGNDPYLLLNSTAAEVTNTDYIDAYSAGFEISSTAPAAINASGGTYIYLAIA